MFRIVELVIDKDSDGIDAVSVVDSPAIESNFIALAKDYEMKLAEVDAEKKILMGAALIPNKQIYRKIDKDEFYVYFSKDTVRLASELFLKNGNQANATLEHKSKIDGMTVVESWIVDDVNLDKSKKYGFDVPEGTWMISMKVDNDEIWNKVKAGEVKGFSIEGYFADKLELQLQENNDKETLKKIIELLELAEVGERGAIVSSPKAPNSDTKNPNPQGEGSAKGDASGKRGAKVTAEQEKTLQNKVDDFNEKDSNTKNGNATLGALKSVFQRGLGAFNTSRSPVVKSAEQWAFARVNAFLYLLKNGRPENAKYTTDYDLLPNKHPKYSKLSKVELESYNDYPQQATENAKIALRYAEENGWGDCGTPVGKQRANQLANREPISEDTIARMASFERHRQSSDKPLGDGCGRLMWLCWGGDAGIEWAQRKLEQIRKD